MAFKEKPVKYFQASVKSVNMIQLSNYGELALKVLSSCMEGFLKIIASIYSLHNICMLRLPQLRGLKFGSCREIMNKISFR